MIKREGTYFGKPCVIACDANCKKAWGLQCRPALYKTVNGTFDVVPDELVNDTAVVPDVDDCAFLSDDELGEAPDDPGTYEGGNAKPRYDEDRLNKWCARECERSVIADVNEPLELPDFSKRRYNMAPHTRNDAVMPKTQEVKREQDD